MIKFILDTCDTMSHMFGTIMFLFLAGMALFSIFMFAYVTFYVIDCIFRPVFSGEGKIISKYFIENDTTPHYHDEYILHIQVGNLIDEYLVSKTNYNKFKEGEFLKVDYSLGRLRKSLYIKSISI